MAEFLYRLGRWSARHARRVALGWFAALLAAGAAYLAFGGTLVQSFSIPDTPTQEVNDLLVAEMGTASGMTGTVVFRAEEGALTPGQQDGISALLADVAGIEGIDTVVDPFATAAARAGQEQQIAEGRAQFDAGQEQLAQEGARLEAAQAEIDAGRAELEAGRAQLDAGRQQLDAAAAELDAAAAAYGEEAVADQRMALEAQRVELEAGLAQLDAAQAQLDAGQAQLDEGAAQLAAGAEQLAAQEGALVDGEALVAHSSEIRTVSADGSTAQAVVIFTDSMFDVDPDLRAAVADRLDDAAIDGVRVDYSAEFTATVEGLLGVGEVVGVLIAAMVLVAMLGTALPAAIPLVTAVTGVGVGITASMALSGAIEMTSVTPVLGVMLGLAVGIDYSLFILNRHRRQLLHGTDPHESIGLANGTSGNAVVFAGSTVFIALLALAVTGMPFLSVMGAVGAFSVLVAVAVAVTLTPALLGVLGPRVLSRRQRARIGGPEHAVAPRPMRTPVAWLAAVAAVAGLLVIAAPATAMRLGLPDGSSEPPGSTQYVTFTTVAEQFGAGQSGPLLVAARVPGPLAADQVTHAQADLAGRFMAMPDVVAVAPVGVSPDGDLLTFQVIPAEGPNSESTADLVHALRDASPLPDGTWLGVAGQASANIDVSDSLAAALPLYLVVVVGLSLVIMTVVFRSIAVPIIATGGFVLSLLAALGAVVAVYQWGWLGGVFGVHHPAPILSFLPIILTGVLFGLAMDYQLFLVSGMREAWVHGTAARPAVTAGRQSARAVVTAAAIIMASVFGGFVFSHLTMVRPLGFGLAIGVLFDAFVVRMVLVPAVMHLLGEKAWWLPRWLDKVLPQADVEGARLERRHPGVPGLTPGV